MATTRRAAGGTELDSQCRFCGAVTEPDAARCDYCGKRLRALRSSDAADRRPAARVVAAVGPAATGSPPPRPVALPVAVEADERVTRGVVEILGLGTTGGDDDVAQLLEILAAVRAGANVPLVASPGAPPEQTFDVVTGQLDRLAANDLVHQPAT